MIAALVLVHLCGPEAGINQEIVSAANDKDQAAQVFKYVSQIIQLSPQLTDVLEVIPSRKRVVYHGRGNTYYAVSSEAGTKHGLNPTVVIYDELAQSKNTDLFDALETSQGAQEEPLFFTISTQSNDPQHPLSVMVDDGLEADDPTIVCHLYEVADETKDIFDEGVWPDANPALGDFRSIIDMRSLAARAKRLPSRENVFRNLFLNQRVTLDATLFPRSVWMACAGKSKIHEGEDVLLALDLSTTTDLSALAMMTVNKPRIQVFFWKPEDLLEEHGKRDRRQYLSMYQRELLEPCPGKTISADLIAAKIVWAMENFNVCGLAYDRWRIDQVINAMARAGVEASTEDDADLKVFPFGQGFRDMSPAIDAFETLVIEGGITHGDHDLLNWNIANAIVTQDAAGNRKLDKSKSRMRIDGAVAATMVAGLHSRFREEDTDSVYRTRDLLIV